MSMQKLTIQEIFKRIRNGLTVKNDANSGGLPITRIETISNGEIDLRRVGYSGIAEGEKDDWLLEKGDILFSHINSIAHIGKCAIYEGAPKKLIHGMNLLAFRADSEKLFPKYALYLLRSQTFKNQLAKSIKPAVNQASVTIADINKIEVDIPPLEEQKRIAAILDKADSLRRKRAQAIALADDFLRAVFLEMFGDPVTNPKGWDTVKLEELILSGPTNGLYKPSSDYVDADGELGVPILRIDGFYNGRIAKGYKFKRVLIDSQTKLKFLLRDKSIVINRVNSKEYVGKAMLVSGLQEATVFESNMMNFSVSLSSVNPRFLVDQLADEFVRRQVAIMRKDAVNQSSINQNDVKSIEIRLPKLGLQEKYTEVAEVIDLLVKKYNEASDDLGCFSDSLRARLLA